MSSVQKLRANASKTSVYAADGDVAATGSVMNLGDLTGGDTFVEFPAAGNAGASTGSMTLSPETNPESGFLTITLAGVEYQIPIYLA